MSAAELAAVVIQGKFRVAAKLRTTATRDPAGKLLAGLLQQDDSDSKLIKKSLRVPRKDLRHITVLLPTSIAKPVKRWDGDSSR